MQKLELKKNLTYVVCIAMVILIVIMNIRTAARFSEFGFFLVDDKLSANVNSLNLRLDVSENYSMAAAVSMAKDPAAVEAIINRDRDEIIRIFSDTFDLYHVNYYTITDSEGIVIARTHNPEAYGDSNADQQNVIDALGGKVSTYFETGTYVAVSLRTGAPVYDEDGALVGVISAGVRFDTDETVDLLKELLGAEVSVFYGDTRIATTLTDGGERVTGTTLDPEIADIVLVQQQEYHGEVTLFGNQYETFYKPLLNADGEAFAIIFLGIPIDDLKSESNTLLFEVILVGIMCVAISLILLRALRNMAAANKAKTSFLSTMSHEIRTPMNAILGITEIQLQNETLSPDVMTALKKIHASGDLLLGIINDILDLSKIEAGKLELLITEYELASLISDTSQLNMMRIGSKPIEFVLDVDENVPVRVLGDELRVKQILNNLLSNAFKYTTKGSVTLSVTAQQPDKNEESVEVLGDYMFANAGAESGIRSESSFSGTGTEVPGVTATPKTESVILVFSISDTGQGMTPEQLSKLGDEYSRFNMETNRRTEGTGLGMSITRNLIKIMSGDLTVESEPGKGSTFTVRLAQGKVDSEVLGREMVENLHRFRTSGRGQMKRTQISREYMPYGKVMVVDDVETNIYVAKGLLTPYGLKIDSAESGYEAIEKLKSGNEYDIVFMDHMMPNMDGVETTRLIREMGYKHPIVALTANAVSGQAEMFLSNGFDDFISKPIDMRQMNSVLNRLIRDKQPPEAIEAARSKKGELVIKDGKASASSGAPEEPGALAPRVAEIFIRDASKSLAVLDKVLEKDGVFDENDLRLYIINTHGMKTALANIGKTELSEIARSLEALGRNGDIGAITAQTPPFLASLRSLMSELSPVEDSAAAEAADENPELLREKLLAIKAACEDFDKNAADKALKELRELSWSKETSKLLSAIAEHLLHSDFDEVVEAVKHKL